MQVIFGKASLYVEIEFIFLSISVLAIKWLQELVDKGGSNSWQTELVVVTLKGREGETEEPVDGFWPAPFPSLQVFRHSNLPWPADSSHASPASLIETCTFPPQTAPCVRVAICLVSVSPTRNAIWTTDLRPRPAGSTGSRDWAPDLIHSKHAINIIEGISYRKKRNSLNKMGSREISFVRWY